MSAKKYQEYDIVPEAERTLVRVRGRTIQELFQNALRGVASFISPASAIPPAAGKKITREIRAQAVDISSLLVEFLSRALAEADARGAIFTTAAFRAFGENFLEAELAGALAEDIAAEIRAVSYADVDIRKNPDTGLFETTLVLEA